MTLRVQDLTVRYGARVAVANASFEVAPGELVALVGPNGAGKSSLVKAIAGVAPYAGRVEWNGAPVATLEARGRARALAYLPQAPTVHWPLNGRDVVALGRLPHRGYGTSAAADDEAAIDWAMAQTATQPFAARAVDRLSVGERARLLLARALAVRAPVLLVDEPTPTLDPYHQLQVMEVLRGYADHGAAANGTVALPTPAVVIAVLHDLALAARYATRVLLLDAGRIAVDDRPEQALGAAAVRRHYRVEPFIARCDDRPLVVPWRRLDS